MADQAEDSLPAPIQRVEAKRKGWLAAINPTNAVRVARAAGRLVGAGFQASDYISGKARDNRSRDRISDAIAERAAAEIKAGSNPDFERAYRRESARLMGEQANLDDVVEIALDSLGSKAESDFFPGDVEEDWLYQFENAAKGFSSERMKHTFARVLAGEILKPGSFSPATLQALVGLDVEAAKLLVRFASLAYRSGAVDPMLLTMSKSAGNNGLSAYGLNFGALSHLSQTGMIGTEYSTHMILTAAALTIPATIGKQTVVFKPQNETFEPMKQITVPALFLTKVGRELSAVVEMDNPDSQYLDDLAAYALTLGLVLHQRT